MPIYSYICNYCRFEFDRVLPLRQYQEPQTCPMCNADTQKVLRPVAVVGDYGGYNCPVTGKWIEGRRAHEENLKRQGCRVLEPGEKEAVIRNRQRDEKALDKSVDETVERFVTELPERKRTELFNEVAAGASPVIERK